MSKTLKWVIGILLLLVVVLVVLKATGAIITGSCFSYYY